MFLYPTDSMQWKKFGDKFPKFGKELRNLKLDLAANGISLFGNLSTNHILWPILLVIYTLPFELYMKRKYIMLFMILSGLRQPGSDIDVSNPLIEDLKLLWDEEVEVFDGFANETFKMHVILFFTINDFLAFGNLSRYSVDRCCSSTKLK